MEIKEEIKQMLKVAGITLLRIIGLTVFITGAVEEIVWLMLIGLLMVDLTPSCIIAHLNNIKRNFA